MELVLSFVEAATISSLLRGAENAKMDVRIASSWNLDLREQV